MSAPRRRVLLLSGPNLNALGFREPEVYGSDTLDQHIARAVEAGRGNGLDVEHMQSQSEGDLVAAVHDGRNRFAAVIINPGALTHYGWSLHDALAAFPGVVVELHLSNPVAREPWRRTSVVAPVADVTIAGAGGTGYRLAVEAVASRLA